MTDNGNSGRPKQSYIDTGSHIVVGMIVIVVPKIIGLDAYIQLYYPIILDMISTSSDLPFPGLMRLLVVFIKLLFFELFPLIVLWLIFGIFLLYRGLTLEGTRSTREDVRRELNIYRAGLAISILYLIFVFT